VVDKTSAHVIQLSARRPVEPKKPADKFSSVDAVLLLRNFKDARAIIRAVLLAACAQDDGSVNYEYNEPERWFPVLDEAVSRLLAVRDLLMETASAPNLDWPTPLALVEAIAAALWHGRPCSKGEKLGLGELQTLAQVAIDAIDSLIDECTSQGVLKMACDDVEPAVH
jgi:hypothetical protein